VMKVLLDENLPHALRHFQWYKHDVRTVTFMGWNGIRNGELIARAAAEGFDALITMDRSIEHHHRKRPLALIVIEAPSNKLDVLMPMVPRIVSALEMCKPGQATRVPWRE
jgi:hypothetical protein